MATFYQSAIAAFNADTNGAIAVTKLAKRAVKLAYSRDSMTECQNMLDLMTKNYAKALPAFFKKAGIGVIDATPQAPAIINKVLDKSAQARVFTWLDREDVWVVNPEDIAPKAKKPAVDVKTDAEAVAKVQGWIDAKLKSLKENGQDNLLAAFQQRMAAPKVEEVEVYVARTFVASDGTVYELDADETEAVIDFLLQRQAAKAQLKVVNG